MGPDGPGPIDRLLRVGNRHVALSSQAGSVPTLYEACAPGVGQEAYVGPGLFPRGERVMPAPAWRAPWARDDRVGRQLWEVSESLTGVSFPV